MMRSNPISSAARVRFIMVKFELEIWLIITYKRDRDFFCLTI
jgi:hypothetical protein